MQPCFYKRTFLLLLYMSMYGALGANSFNTEFKKKQEKPLPLGAIDQSLEKYFRKNKREVPPIEVLILFTRHDTQEDATWLEKYYQEADIFIQESSGWTPESLSARQNMADGKPLPRGMKYRGGDFGKELNWIIKKNPGKRVTLIDIPQSRVESEKLIKTEIDVDKNLSKIVKEGLPLPEVASKMYEAMLPAVAHDDLREQIMIETLPVQLANLIKQYPELAKKPKLKVVMLLGAAHTRVYQWMHDRGDNVSRKFQEMPQLYLGNASISRAELLNKPLSQESKEAVFFLDIARVHTFLGKVEGFTSFPEFQAYKKFIMKNLSKPEMESLYEIFRKDGQRKFGKAFEAILESKYIPIIKTPADAQKVRDWILEEDKQKEEE